ncbi:MAG: YybS family protein [Synergistaceae bacterium]|jgi:uncharacterized protein YybS (DUF2232 family)|nr:YybS family protein [Synergistaceae bacterium]
MSSNTVSREWFLCSAVSLALFAACMVLPALSPIFLAICPFPQALLTYERGLWAGTLSVLTVACAIFFSFAAVPSAIYTLSIGSAGVMLGVIARKLRGGDMLLLGIICSLGCKLAAAFFLYSATGFSLFHPDPASLEQTLFSLAQSRLAALSGVDAQALAENIANSVRYVLLLIPFNLILFSSLEVFFSYVLASRIHTARGGEAFFKLPPFGKWSFPRNILVALVVGLVCEFASRGNPDSFLLAQVSANLGALTWTLFAIQGLAVAYCFMEIRGFPKALRVVIIILTPLSQFLGSIFSIVGIIDMGFDLRKWARRKRQ